MPELAEVEFFRKRWDPGLGRIVNRVRLHPKARIFRETDPGVIRRELKGRSFVASVTHGKNLLFQFGGGRWLDGHLGMTGKLHTGPANYRPEKHDHLVLFVESVALIFTDPRMFGRVRLDRTPDGETVPEWWRALPPEILSKAFTKTFVADTLARRPKTPIKTLLLDQQAFPGIGNWMADEICWRIGIDPATPAGELAVGVSMEGGAPSPPKQMEGGAPSPPKQIEGGAPSPPEPAPSPSTLWKALRLLCRQALRVIGDDWKTPPNAWLFNHRWKDGGRCPRKECRAALVRAELRGRRTCWCPRCQSDNGQERSQR